MILFLFLSLTYIIIMIFFSWHLLLLWLKVYPLLMSIILPIYQKVIPHESVSLWLVTCALDPVGCTFWQRGSPHFMLSIRPKIEHE